MNPKYKGISNQGFSRLAKAVKGQTKFDNIDDITEYFIRTTKSDLIEDQHEEDWYNLEFRMDSWNEFVENLILKGWVDSEELDLSFPSSLREGAEILESVEHPLEEYLNLKEAWLSYEGEDIGASMTSDGVVLYDGENNDITDEVKKEFPGINMFWSGYAGGYGWVNLDNKIYRKYKGKWE